MKVGRNAARRIGRHYPIKGLNSRIKGLILALIKSKTVIDPYGRSRSLFAFFRLLRYVS